MGQPGGSYLLIGGLVGVLSLLTVPVEHLAPAVELSPLAMRTLALVQPAVLTTVLVLVGNVLAPRVGLDAPLVRAWSAGEKPTSVARRQLPPAAIVATLVAALLVAYSWTVVPQIAAHGSDAFSWFSATGPPLLTKLLYGGITEELITRWGLMSLFVWIGWHAVQRPAHPPDWIFWIAIVFSALLFAAGHLPLLFALTTNIPDWIAGAVLVGNAVPGVLFGWLFWRHGLEAAMMAHGGAHLLAALAQAG